MELIKEKVSIGEIVFSDSFEVTADGDLIVPDVRPDIMKILQVDAVSCISSKSIADGKLTVSGKVNFTVLYLPEGDTPVPQSIHTSVDFSHRIDNPNIGEDCYASVNSDIGKVDFHVINSRKISLRAATVICCEVICTRMPEFASRAEEGAEVCTGEMELNTLLGMHDEEFLIRDSIEIPSGKSSIGEILRIDFRICDKELKSLTEKLVLKGTLGVHILYTDTNDCIEYTDAELPFTEVFDFPDLGEENTCDINLRICDYSYETSADSDGDMRIINFEMVVAAEMRSEQKENFEIIKDCFLPGSKTKLTYTETEINTVAASISTQNTLRDSAALSPDAPGIKAIYDTVSKAVVTKSEVRDGKLAVEGRAETYILYISDDPSTSLCSFKKDIPFEYLLDCPEARPGMESCIDAEICHVNYHLNVAGEVEIRCILSICAKLLEKRTLMLISDAVNEEIPKDKKKGIVIYFVQPGDTLWKIAKEYCVSVEDIAEFNSISDRNNISVGQRLIIPAKKC